MNVLFLTCWYPSETQPFFGIFVHEHARAVAAAGHNVKILHIWRRPGNENWVIKKQRYHRDGIEIFSATIHSKAYKWIHHIWPLMDRTVSSVFFDQIEPHFKPDLIHGNVLYPAGFLSRNLADKLNIPYVLSEHWSKVKSFFSNPLSIYRWMGQKVLNEAAGIYPVSSYLKQYLADRVSEENITVIPNVVDENVFYYRQLERVREKTINLLSVMNLAHPVKRLDVVFEAWKALPVSIKDNYVLRIIGSNQKNCPLRKHIEQTGLSDQVYFDGEQPKEYVAECMRMADVLVHPTEMETFGVVVAEALQTGLPCMASDIPALRELIDKDSGWLVPGYEIAEWKKYLSKLPNLLETIDRQQIARKNIQRFSLKAVGQQFDLEYRKILE